MIPRFSRSSALIVLLLSTGLPTLAGQDAPGEGRRVPWAGSRFRGTPDPPPPYAVEPAFPKLTFDRPVLVEHVPGTDRLVVGEVAGKVVSFPEEPGADRTDLAIDLNASGPRCEALYGLAFHPKFEDNRTVFLCYVTKTGDPEGTRVSRFAVRPGPVPVIDPASEEVLLTWVGGGHNGGCLAFGTDGCLYISTGDAEGPTPPDPKMTGQDLSDLPSSILRIDVDGRDPGRAYRVPPDNPFRETPGARPEIWAYGFRNPWRMSFDRETGNLWVGDVGWELWEMIFRVERGGNYGWSLVESRQPVHPEGRRGPTPVLPPVVEHPHSEAASITGGYVYRGDRLKDLVGAYIYGDYQSGKVWGLRFDGKDVTWRGELADTGLRLVSFGEGGRGELYLVEHERSNQLYRLVPAAAPEGPRDFPTRLSGSGLFSSARDHRPAPGVVPYAINAESWMDGATARRLLAIPGDGRIEIDAEGYWRLPEGSVLARTVSIELAAGDPSTSRRVETQILHFEDGSWRPYTYAWDDDQSDATLVDAQGSTRTFDIRDPDAPGGRRTHEYRIAARSECVLCHNPWVGAKTTVFGRQSASPLALTSAQMNVSATDEGSNPIRILEHLDYFPASLPDDLPRLANPYDDSADHASRARSYLQVNCAHCHQFNAGGTATIDLRASIPLEQTQTVGARPTQGAFGLDDARIIAPGHPERSVLYYRTCTTGAGRMPRIGSRRVDVAGTRLLADWIAGMPAIPPSPRPESVAEALAKLGDPRAPAPARGEAIRLLAGSTEGALALVRSIDRGRVKVEPSEIAPVLRDTPRPEVRDLLERFVPESERLKRLGDTIDPEALMALEGDADRGRRWFFSTSATSCGSCHRIGGQGTELGPDLGAIGTKYSRRDLLRHVLEPSREIDPRYAARTIATTDGRVLVGLPVERTAREVVLRDAKGQTHRIPLDQVEEESTSRTSLMPEGLLRELTAEQAADILRFLSDCKDPAKPVAP